MTSDQGREFVNKVNDELMALAGMEGNMLIISSKARGYSNKLSSSITVLLCIPACSCLNFIGTDHRMTSAYHPQSNGLVERLNQTVQNILLKLVNHHQNNWDELLDPALFAIRTSRQKSTKYTPFEVMFNRYIDNNYVMPMIYKPTPSLAQSSCMLCNKPFPF